MSAIRLIAKGKAARARQCFDRYSMYLCSGHTPFVRRAEVQPAVPEAPWIDVEPNANVVRKKIVNTHKTVNLSTTRISDSS